MWQGIVGGLRPHIKENTLGGEMLPPPLALLSYITLAEAGLQPEATLGPPHLGSRNRLQQNAGESHQAGTMNEKTKARLELSLALSAGLECIPSKPLIISQAALISEAST